jgi:MSHA pilin protein MshD
MSSERGLTLIELIIFMVVVSIGIVGVLLLFTQLTKQSADPLIRKQALAVAQSLMDEIQLRAFTYCDPDDEDVYTATSTAGCAATAPNDVEVIGAESGEGRYGATAATRFDNVNDYHGFAMSGVNMKDIKNDQIVGLESYSASVQVATMTGDLPSMITNDDALLITVTVSGPLNISVTLQGYRLRYAPNSP